MKVNITLILLAFLYGCSIGRTKYQPYGRTGGYSEQQINDKVMVARFSGNAYTNSNDAQTFSNFRALEICREKGYSFAHIHSMKDLSTSQTVQKTSNYNYQDPTYFSGSANSNANFNSFGGNMGQINQNTNFNGTVYGGNNYGGSSTWQETYRYPTFDTIFSCSNSFYTFGIEINSIPTDDMKTLVKDFMGAVQIKNVLNESPNKGILLTGDIIIKVNGTRVENELQFHIAKESAIDKNKIPLVIFREGKQINLTAQAKDVTAFIETEIQKFISNTCMVSEVKNRPICINRIPAEK